MTTANLPAFKVEPAKTLATKGSVKLLLEHLRPSIAETIPKHLTAERLCKTAMLAVAKQPKLLQCTQESFMGAIIDAASLGLDCSGGTLGQGYLIPYGKTCQFIPGYRGLMDLARRGGDVTTISARVVYEGDVFSYEFGDNEHIKHKPMGEEDPDKITHAYMRAEFKDGGIYREVMTKNEIDSVRRQSKSGNNGPWVTHFPQMAIKSVIRRGIKYLPLNSELLAHALELSDKENEPIIIEAEPVDMTKPGKHKLKPNVKDDIPDGE